MNFHSQGRAPLLRICFNQNNLKILQKKLKLRLKDKNSKTNKIQAITFVDKINESSVQKWYYKRSFLSRIELHPYPLGNHIDYQIDQSS